MKIKRLLLVFFALSALVLSKCWNSREINKLAIVTAIGIDKAPSGMLVTIQVLNPRAIAAKNPAQQTPQVVFKEEGSDLNEILNRISLSLARFIYLPHLRTVILGEAFAKEGVKDVLDYLLRDHEFRTDYNFVIAKGTTANAILNIIPTLTDISGIKIYDSLKLTDEFTGVTKPVKIIELINNIAADGKDPVISGVEETGEDINEVSTIESLKKPQLSHNFKLSSLAVFKGDKLAGWLTYDDSMAYNFITGNAKFASVFFEVETGKTIGIYIKKVNSVPKAVLNDGKPAINVDITIEADINYLKGKFDVTKTENLDKVNRMGSKKIADMCFSAINSAVNYQSDIFGFGELIHRSYPDWWNKNKDNWGKKLTNLPVTVKVGIKVEKFGAISKQFFIKGEE